MLTKWKEKKDYYIKIFLLSLSVFSVLFSCFSSAENVSSLVNSHNLGNINVYVSENSIFTLDYSSSIIKTICFKSNNGAGSLSVKCGNGNYHILDNNNQYTCFSSVGGATCYGKANSFMTSNQFTYFILSDLLSETIPSQYTSLECQTEYNLIPISSVDSNYCQTNNLCPSCPICPSGSGGVYSNVYINDILHVGASNIIMNISEEIDWDYEYTAGGNNMNIDVVGYNVDYEKMQEVIDIQKYKPDNEDLENVITNIIPLFVPGLCIILLLYFIFKFIKKVF